MQFEVRHKDVAFDLPYTYARGHDLSCTLVQVELRDGDTIGRGEGAPFESFFEAPAGDTVRELEEIRPAVEQNVTREELLSLLPPGSGRNALDAALWDFEAKRTGTPVWRLLDLAEPVPIEIMTTISLSNAKQLSQELADSSGSRILKLKLGSDNDPERLVLTRQARPEAELVVDVNGGWTIDTLRAMLPLLEQHRVRMIEQPVGVEYEDELRGLPRSIPLIADESFSCEDDFGRVLGRYDGVNVKLDKCGGLTAALRIIERARQNGLRIMVGCLPASSLSAAAGFHAAQSAEFVDLDGHVRLVTDSQPAMAYKNGWLHPPTPELWG